MLTGNPMGIGHCIALTALSLRHVFHLNRFLAHSVEAMGSSLCREELKCEAQTVHSMRFPMYVVKAPVRLDSETAFFRR